MTPPRALEKLNGRMRPLPPHKLTIGIFSNLWLTEKSASLIVEALYSSVKKILRRVPGALQTPHFQGFSRFSYVRWRKRPVLKSRIIDSHAVLRVGAPARLTVLGPGGVRAPQPGASREASRGQQTRGVPGFPRSRRARAQLAAAGCAILDPTALQQQKQRHSWRAGSAIGSVQGARVTGSAVMWRRNRITGQPVGF